MDDDDNNNDTSSSSLTIPIIEDNEKLLSSMTTNIPIISPEKIEENNSHQPNLDHNEIRSPLFESRSPQTTIISTILDTVITEIESNNNNLQLNTLPIIEDDQLDIDEEEDDDDENDDEDEEEQENPEKNLSIKYITYY